MLKIVEAMFIYELDENRIELATAIVLLSEVSSPSCEVILRRKKMKTFAERPSRGSSPMKRS